VERLSQQSDELAELRQQNQELDKRNLELEALEADLKNVVALKDEEIEQLRSTQNKPPEASRQEPDYQTIANRVLASLKLGTQSPGYKAARKALLVFIQQLTTDN
jgi:signal transduction histidine kinase